MKRQTFFLKTIIASLLRRRSRMLIALLAVGMGATILFGLITLYHDVPRQMGEEFRSYGANVLLVPTEHDFKRQQLQEVLVKLQGQQASAAAFKFNNIKVNEQPFLLAATDFTQTLKTLPFWGINGQLPQNSDEVLVGLEVAKRLGISTDTEIKLTTLGDEPEELSVKVAGILQTGDSQEEQIFVSFDAYEKLYQDNTLIDVAQLSVRTQGKALEELTEQINSSQQQIKASVVRRLANSETLVLGKLKALVLIVTVVVLALTMVCVGTTMMAVVSERRKEIGLRKALGAKQKSIMAEFMGEAFFLGLLGGFLGIILGYGFALYVSLQVFGRNLSSSPLLMLATLVISIGVTLLASYLPVRSTTQVKPALVLKGE